MTAAQREYLAHHGIDPWALDWTTEKEAGLSSGLVEAAVFPTGQVLRGNGIIASLERHDG